MLKCGWINVLMFTKKRQYGFKDSGKSGIHSEKTVEESYFINDDNYSIKTFRHQLRWYFDYNQGVTRDTLLLVQSELRKVSHQGSIDFDWLNSCLGNEWHTIFNRETYHPNVTMILKLLFGPPMLSFVPKVILETYLNRLIHRLVEVHCWKKIIKKLITSVS